MPRLTGKGERAMSEGSRVAKADRTRRWSTTPDTKAAILAAAQSVFLDFGYTAANVSDVVERSGSSVGSIYHHFGGKAELFQALCRGYHDTLHDASAQAMTAAREAGVTDPVDLFAESARAYMEQAWAHREMTRLVHGGDHPQGHVRWRREQFQLWLSEVTELFMVTTDSPGDRVRLLVLTTISSDAARLLTEIDSPDEAGEIIEAALVLVRKLAS